MPSGDHTDGGSKWEVEDGDDGQVPTWSHGQMAAAGFEWVPSQDGMSGRWADPEVAARLRTAEDAVKALGARMEALSAKCVEALAIPYVQRWQHPVFIQMARELDSQP